VVDRFIVKGFEIIPAQKGPLKFFELRESMQGPHRIMAYLSAGFILNVPSLIPSSIAYDQKRQDPACPC